MYFSDSHFVIGGFHVKHKTPCQDHALCCMENTSRLIVVSDGCSTGGLTDIGSRIITCATIMAFRLYADIGDMDPLSKRLPHVMLNQIRVMAQSNKNMMGLVNKDLYATCVYALMTPTGGFVHVLGDGCVILKFSDGSIIAYTYEWQNNTPCYPIYEGEDLKKFIAVHKQFEEGDKSLTINKIMISPEGAVVSESSFLPIMEVFGGHVIPVTSEMIESGLECIAICSDGVESFVEKDRKIPSEEIIKQVVAFKNLNGDFVKRRLTRLLADYAKVEIRPYDDFAVAAITLNQIIPEEDDTKNP